MAERERRRSGVSVLIVLLSILLLAGIAVITYFIIVYFNNDEWDKTGVLADVELSVQGHALTINHEEDFYLNELSVERPVTFGLNNYKKAEMQITYHANDGSDGISVKNNVISLNKVNQNAYFNVIVIRETTAIAAKIYLTEPTFPSVNTSGYSLAEGDYYLTAQPQGAGNTSFLLKISRNGEIKYYKKVDAFATDFRKVVTNDGRTRYLYACEMSDKFNSHTIGDDALYSNAKYIVLDENYQKINEIGYALAGKSEYPIERHDIIYLNDDHYIVATTKTKTIAGSEIPEYMLGDKSQPMRVVSNLIQERKNGQTVWEFDSTNEPELYGYYSKNMQKYISTGEPINWVQYMDFNSMDIDSSDGNLLACFKAINAVAKINRTTGKLMWVLGGDGCEYGLSEAFCNQHSVEMLENGKFSILNNGNREQNSTILEIGFDEATSTATVLREYDLGVISNARGSCMRVSGSDIYAVCYGLVEGKSSVIDEINIATGDKSFVINISNCDSLFSVFAG